MQYTYTSIIIFLFATGDYPSQGGRGRARQGGRGRSLHGYSGYGDYEEDEGFGRRQETADLLRGLDDVLR